MKRLLILFCLALALVGCANTPNSLYSKSQVAYGKSLFEGGYYRQAMKQLLPLACDGNAEAEYAVGYMYYYGYGVQQDTDVGYMWIQRAAQKHNCEAMAALQLMDKNRGEKQPVNSCEKAKSRKN